MKRLFSILTCVVLATSAMTDIVFAESEVRDNSSTTNILYCGDEGIDKILNSEDETDSVSRKIADSKTSDGNSLTAEQEKDGATDISFNTAEEDGITKIYMTGEFSNNDIQCEVNAEGELETYITEKLGDLQLGHLKGTIIVGDYERNINVNYEKTSDNLYYSITINTIDSTEGFAVITFGESKINKSVLEELGFIKEEENEDVEEKNIASTRSYGSQVDADWAELKNYGGAILRGRLFLEDDIVDDGDNGKMLVVVQVDENEAKDLIEGRLGYDTLAIMVDEFLVDFDSLDEESSFGNHHPDETDSDDTVYNFILDVFGDLGVPSSVISIISSVGDGTGNDIYIGFDNDMYRRRFVIEPENDIYMNWAKYPKGGYPVQIYVNKDNNVTDDDIDIDFNADLKVYLDYNSFYVSTEDGDLDVDLANY